MEGVTRHLRPNPCHFALSFRAAAGQVREADRHNLVNLRSHPARSFLDVRQTVCSVAKSHDQIQEFIIKYNLRFRGKLVFGTFMMKGLGEVCNNADASDWDPFLQFL